MRSDRSFLATLSPGYRLMFALLGVMTHAALAETTGICLPANAQEIEPGIYHVGRITDRAGRVVDGIAFVHSRQREAKPGGGGGGPKPDPCYSLLGGVRWRSVEDYVVSPSIANDATDGAMFMEQIETALANWEVAAGTEIFGSATVGDVDLELLGNAPNEVNEVTFAFIENPSTLAITFIWSDFSGPPDRREIFEWDTVFRLDVPWSTAEPYPGYHYDLWNCAAHEFGHAAGLGHPSDTCTEETMYRFISAGETRKQTLEPGDLAGIAELYR